MAIEEQLAELSAKVDKLTAALKDFQMPQDSGKIALNVKEAADLIGVSPPQVYLRIDTDPSFPAVRFGERRTVINRRKLSEWMDEQAERRII